MAICVVALGCGSGSGRSDPRPEPASSCHGNNGDPSTVVAFDARDGSVKWERAAGYSITGTIVTAGSFFVVGGDDGVIRTFDRDTGDERWCARGGPTVAVAGALVIAAQQGTNDVVAYDAISGAERWRAGLAPVDPELSGFENAVVTDAAGIYIAASQPSAAPDVAALDLGGERRWTSDRVACTGPVSPTQACVAAGSAGLSLAGGNVISMDRNGQQVVALDAATGSVVWRVPFGGDELRPLGSDTKVLIAERISRDGTTLVALDLGDGHELWSRPSAAFGAVVADGELVTVEQTAASYTVTALEAATGAPRWSFTAPGFTYYPGAVGGIVVLPTGGDGLAAFERDTGRARWQISHPNPGQGDSLPNSSGYRGFAGDASIIASVITAIPREDD